MFQSYSIFLFLNSDVVIIRTIIKEHVFQDLSTFSSVSYTPRIFMHCSEIFCLICSGCIHQKNTSFALVLGGVRPSISIPSERTLFNINKLNLPSLPRSRKEIVAMGAFSKIPFQGAKMPIFMLLCIFAYKPINKWQRT